MKYRILSYERFDIEKGFQVAFKVERRHKIFPMWVPAAHQEIDSWGGTRPVEFDSFQEAEEFIKKHKNSYDWVLKDKYYR